MSDRTKTTEAEPGFPQADLSDLLDSLGFQARFDKDVPSAPSIRIESIQCIDPARIGRDDYVNSIIDDFLSDLAQQVAQTFPVGSTVYLFEPEDELRFSQGRYPPFCIFVTRAGESVCLHMEMMARVLPDVVERVGQ